VVEAIRTTKQSINSKEERIVKQDESDGDSKFIVAIGFGGKLSRS
jgi:hypothetical protein